jgi:hypothetical protein
MRLWGSPPEVSLGGGLLLFVVHRPALSEPAFVNEIATRLLLLSGRREAKVLGGSKTRHKPFHHCKSRIKPRSHRESDCAPEMRPRQFPSVL